jgi:general secretion pathway protein E
MEFLLRNGKISPADAERSRNLQEQTGGKECRILLDLGLIPEEDLRDAYADLLGLPIWEKKKKQTYPIVDELPYNFLLANKVLPLDTKNARLSVALANPCDTSLLEVLRYRTNKDIESYVGCEKDIVASINDTYIEDTEQPAISEGAAVELSEDIERLKDLATEAPVIRTVNNFLNKAIETKASDVHLERFEKAVRLKYRIDGVLIELPPPAMELYPAIVSRIKIMSKLNIAEKRLAQDGRIKLTVMGKQIDIRVSVIPTIYGESVVLRILDRATITEELDKIGFGGETLRDLKELISKPEGMILVTGPTGSGKTTTLYGALEEIRRPEIKIITVEDPVEYSIDGINQIQVNPQIGLVFSSVLRNVLRHDPDVILVGEIRDAETAKIAMQASLTGHLVLSTLHTYDAASAFTRLLDMGVEAYLLSSCVIGVLAQRLVRRLCQNCAQSYYPSDEISGGIQIGKLQKLFRAVGCDECNNTGYRGRIAVAELLVVDDNVRRLVLKQEDSKVIKGEIEKRGMKTIWDDGMHKVLKGLTSVEELYRVTAQTR